MKAQKIKIERDRLLVITSSMYKINMMSLGSGDVISKRGGHNKFIRLQGGRRLSNSLVTLFACGGKCAIAPFDITVRAKVSLLVYFT